MKKIILASASPRRKELLTKVGFKFEVAVSYFEEKINFQLSPEKIVKELAQSKARSVAEKYPDAIVIAADTIIVLEKKIVGKPKNKADARQILRLLSGKAHSVITGFVVFDTKTKQAVVKHVETQVFFKKIPEKKIIAYVETGEPLDKAGAYAIQGKGSFLVERIEGDYENVVGLPVKALIKELKKFDR